MWCISKEALDSFVAYSHIVAVTSIVFIAGLDVDNKLRDQNIPAIWQVYSVMV